MKQIFPIIIYLLISSCHNAFFRQSVSAGHVEQVSTAQPLNIIQKNGLFFIPVEIGATTYHFLFDTGAGVSVVDSRLATKMQYKRLRSAPVSNASDSKQQFNFIEFKHLKISHLAFTNTIAITEDFSNFPIDISNFGGIIGQPIINKAHWKIDFAIHQIELAMTAFDYDKNNAIPVTFGDNRLPYITLDIEGMSHDILLDTGCSDMLDLSKKAKSSHYLQNKYPVRTHELEVYTLGEQRTVLIKELKIPQVTLGKNTTIKNVYVRIDNIKNPKIGTPMFKDKVLIIDTQQQQIAVE